MTHHIPYVLDAIVLAALGTVSAASAVVLNAPADAVTSAELQLFLLPFIGALVLGGGMIMLNPQPETRKIVCGRSAVAIFFGILAPQLIGAIHPNLAALSVKPVFLVLFGGLTAALSYALSWPFTRQLYAKADGIAQREADRLEAKFSPPVNNDTPPTSPPTN